MGMMREKKYWVIKKRYSFRQKDGGNGIFCGIVEFSREGEIRNKEENKKTLL